MAGDADSDRAGLERRILKAFENTIMNRQAIESRQTEVRRAAGSRWLDHDQEFAETAASVA